MCARRFLLLVALGVVLLPARLDAADPRHCLTKEQQRAAIANGKAVRLAVALRAAKGRLNGEVVRARLCDGNQGLVYQLTLLARDGKVARLHVDAASGAVIGTH